MKVVLTGLSGLDNRGVEALASTIVEQLARREPNITINFLSDRPDYDQAYLQHERVNFVKDLLNTPSNQKSLLQRLGNRGSRLYKPLSPQYRLFSEASVVIASGGDIFSSDYGGLKSHLKPLELALHAGVPLMFLAQSIGPFKSDDEANAWVRVARRSRLITVREKLSYNYVTKDLGISADFVKHTADSAFLLEPPSPQLVANLLKSYGVMEDRPVVAIAPSQGISYFSNSNYNKHLQALHQVISFILNELNAQVLLIPHVHDIRPTNNDLILATNLHKLFDFDPRIHLAGAEHSASELKGLIGACDMVIAERMHAAIAGVSSGVCTVVVGYSVKAEGIMTDLFGSEAVQKGLLISTQHFLDEHFALQTVRTAWNHRNEVADQLQKVIPKVKQDAASNFDLISQILVNHN